MSETNGTKDIYTVHKSVGPALAEEFLKRNTCNYRKLRPQWVSKRAADMLAGRYKHTHQGIAFDKDGNLIDGQHTLSAIIESGCTIEIPVTYNLDKDAADAIDQGGGRRVIDILKNQGVSDIRPSFVGIARLLHFPAAAIGPAPSNSKQVAMFYQHEAAIRGVFDMMDTSKRRMEIVPMLTPIVRAWYSAEQVQLQEFCSTLSQGYLDGADSGQVKCVLLLRDFVIGLKTTGAGQPLKEIYLKTERALHAYLNNQPLGRLVMATKELFPLPEEV